jgi:hypothetical protein
MKLISLVFCLPIFAQNQPGWIMSGSAQAGDVGFSFETRLEPASPRIEGLGLGGVVGGNPSAHRYTADSIHHVYFGYDIEIGPLPQARAYLLTIRPLSLAREKLPALTNPSSWTALPLPGYPPPQTVYVGDTIALDLMENRSTGQKIVDYIRIQSRAHLGSPRDFSVEDAELHISQPKVTLYGKALETEERDVTGPIVWFTLPNRGRYVLSIAPHPTLGFVKAGEIRADSLTFTLGGDTITLDCGAPIAPGYTPYNLYVYQDRSNSKPRFELGAAARAEALLRR